MMLLSRTERTAMNGTLKSKNTDVPPLPALTEENLEPTADVRTKKGRKVISLAAWMSEPRIRSLRIWDVNLPGTHNSASWCLAPHYKRRWDAAAFAFLKLYIHCQHVTIYEQLEKGVRFLDLRVCKGLGCRKEPYCAHGGFLTLPFRDVLQQVADFCETYPMEVIVLSVRRDVAYLYGPASLSVIESDFLVALMLRPFLGPALTANVTVGQLADRGQNVLYFFEERERYFPDAQQKMEKGSRNTSASSALDPVPYGQNSFSTETSESSFFYASSKTSETKSETGSPRLSVSPPRRSVIATLVSPRLALKSRPLSLCPSKASEQMTVLSEQQSSGVDEKRFSSSTQYSELDSSALYGSPSASSSSLSSSVTSVPSKTLVGTCERLDSVVLPPVHCTNNAIHEQHSAQAEGLFPQRLVTRWLKQNVPRFWYHRLESLPRAVYQKFLSELITEDGSNNAAQSQVNAFSPAASVNGKSETPLVGDITSFWSHASAHEHTGSAAPVHSQLGRRATTVKKINTLRLKKHKMRDALFVESSRFTPDDSSPERMKQYARRDVWTPKLRVIKRRKSAPASCGARRGRRGRRSSLSTIVSLAVSLNQGRFVNDAHDLWWRRRADSLMFLPGQLLLRRKIERELSLRHKNSSFLSSLQSPVVGQHGYSSFSTEKTDSVLRDQFFRCLPGNQDSTRPEEKKKTLKRFKHCLLFDSLPRDLPTASLQRKTSSGQTTVVKRKKKRKGATAAAAAPESGFSNRSEVPLLPTSVLRGEVNMLRGSSAVDLGGSKKRHQPLELLTLPNQSPREHKAGTRSRSRRHSVSFLESERDGCWEAASREETPVRLTRHTSTTRAKEKAALVGRVRAKKVKEKMSRSETGCSRSYGKAKRKMNLPKLERPGAAKDMRIVEKKAEATAPYGALKRRHNRLGTGSFYQVLTPFARGETRIVKSWSKTTDPQPEGLCKKLVSWSISHGSTRPRPPFVFRILAGEVTPPSFDSSASRSSITVLHFWTTQGAATLCAQHGGLKTAATETHKLLLKTVMTRNVMNFVNGITHDFVNSTVVSRVIKLNLLAVHMMKAQPTAVASDILNQL